MYVNYGELPVDKDVQDVSVGPAPAWYRPSGVMFPVGFPGGYRGYGNYENYGDREGEAEVNPVETIQDLKFKQEMPKTVPPAAARYTDIDPLSPLFRNTGAKYGFGDFGQAGFITAFGNAIRSPIVLLLLIGSVAGIYFLYIKPKHSPVS
jgi:hypothetical protein